MLAPLHWHELVAEALQDGPCTSVLFGAVTGEAELPPPGQDLVRSFLPTQQDSPSARSRIETRLAGLALATGDPELEGLRAEFRPVPPEDYESSWRESWKPFRVRKLCVLPSWCEGGPRAGELRLTLEPGGSFGSGRHATTRTCLKVLQERVRGGERVLDAGSGSGILAVTAAVLGATEVLGFDLDPNSKAYGDALALQNGVGARTSFRLGDFAVLEERDTGYDLVLANIYSDVIQRYAPELRARLARAGCFVFSGCPRHHAQATRAAIEAAGLRVEEERALGQWMTFVGSPTR